jgi:hypothetical protein
MALVDGHQLTRLPATDGAGLIGPLIPDDHVKG